MEDEMYLMSIRPKFALQIFRGEKRFELRRLRGRPISPGSLIIVYVSGNIRSIMGEFRVGRVIVGNPRRVWREAAGTPGAGLDEDDWPYIKGSKAAMALEVVDARTYPRPISLEELRSIFPGWNPPMSFRPIGEGDPLVELLIKKLRSARGTLRQGE
jgi:predicted transcriptional regulator